MLQTLWFSGREVRSVDRQGSDQPDLAAEFGRRSQYLVSRLASKVSVFLCGNTVCRLTVNHGGGLGDDPGSNVWSFLEEGRRRVSQSQDL